MPTKPKAERVIRGVGMVKHHAYDKITRKQKTTIYVKFVDKLGTEGEVVAKDNLNFEHDEIGHRKFLKMLGLDDLNKKTPIMVEMSIKEERLDDWMETAYPDGDPDDEEGGQSKID